MNRRENDFLLARSEDDEPATPFQMWIKLINESNKEKIREIYKKCKFQNEPIIFRHCIRLGASIEDNDDPSYDVILFYISNLAIPAILPYYDSLSDEMKRSEAVQRRIVALLYTDESLTEWLNVFKDKSLEEITFIEIMIKFYTNENLYETLKHHIDLLEKWSDARRYFVLSLDSHVHTISYFVKNISNLTRADLLTIFSGAFIDSDEKVELFRQCNKKDDIILRAYILNEMSLVDDLTMFEPLSDIEKIIIARKM